MSSSRFVIVQRQPNRPLVLALVAVAWLVSLLTASWFSWQTGADQADPNRTEHKREISSLSDELKLTRKDVQRLEQQIVDLRIADKITVEANKSLQDSLVARDEEISALRADVAFYERLVGATGQRKGLSVHEASFQRESAGSWRYTVTLTQNLNRAATSQGTMSFELEGVSGDTLRVVSWNKLVPESIGAGQAFSFRYFQQLKGSIMLPKGFKPQRVKIKLSSKSGVIEQTLPWNDQIASR